MKILLIGNSHTYYNNMGETLAQLIEAGTGTRPHVTINTDPGKSLLWHTEQKDVAFNLKYGRYDFVVLQDKQNDFPGEDALYEAAEKLLSYTDSAVTTPIAYMTWTIKDLPEALEGMSTAYRNVAKRLNMRIAPIGEVFATVRDINLYAGDNQHASPEGSYLVALCLYRAITGRSPVGLPELSIAAETARVLQEAAAAGVYNC